MRGFNPYLLLQAAIIAAGGKLSITEEDLMEAQMGLIGGAMLHAIHLPRHRGYELIIRDPNAPIQETATVIERPAFLAPPNE